MQRSILIISRYTQQGNSFYIAAAGREAEGGHDNGGPERGGGRGKEARQTDQETSKGKINKSQAVKCR